MKDYIPGGMLQPGRNFNSNSYQHGFNGMLKDDEIAGVTGANYTAEYWEYDTRTLRRWNTDPMTNPWEVSYACFNENPIYFSDPHGLYGTESKAERMHKRAEKAGLIWAIYNTPDLEGNADYGFNTTAPGEPAFTANFNRTHFQNGVTLYATTLPGTNNLNAPFIWPATHTFLDVYVNGKSTILHMAHPVLLLSVLLVVVL